MGEYTPSEDYLNESHISDNISSSLSESFEAGSYSYVQEDLEVRVEIIDNETGQSIVVHTNNGMEVTATTIQVIKSHFADLNPTVSVTRTHYKNDEIRTSFWHTHMQERENPSRIKSFNMDELMNASEVTRIIGYVKKAVTKVN